MNCFPDHAVSLLSAALHIFLCDKTEQRGPDTECNMCTGTQLIIIFFVLGTMKALDPLLRK